MKTILIAAASLMTAASVYGLIDYNRTSAQPEFKKMYQQEKMQPKVTAIVAGPEVQKEIAIAKAEEKSKIKPEKRKSSRPKFLLKDFSRAKLELVPDEPKQEIKTDSTGKTE